MTSYMRTITSKGQFTIPIALARKYGLKRGDPVLLDVVDHTLLVQPMRVAGVRFDPVSGRFSARCINPHGTQELGDLTDLTARRVVQLTQDPTLPERSQAAPNAWIQPREGATP